MTSAEVKKGTLPEVAEVTSNFPSVQTDFRLRKRKSLATSSNGSAPLPKGRVEERESHLRSLPLLPEKDQRKSTPTAAAYAGAVSRFCDLHGLTPDASTGDKAALEIDGVVVASHMARYEARSIIEGAAQILGGAASMWNRMDSQQRRAFAAVLYPSGLVWSDDLVRTGASGSLFDRLRTVSTLELSLASPSGCNTNRPALYDLLITFKPLMEFAA